jgi:hypothetical protein
VKRGWYSPENTLEQAGEDPKTYSDKTLKEWVRKADTKVESSARVLDEWSLKTKQQEKPPESAQA